MKSTFQKPDATYPHGSLREQPEMKKPDESHYNFMKDANKIANFEHVRFEQDKRAYQKHLDSLRTIPCSENNWKDGQELEEGKDYTVTQDKEMIEAFGLLAVPLPVQETERKFTLEQMIDCWNAGAHSSFEMNEYFKEKLNIDL